MPVCPADDPDDLAKRIADVAREAWIRMSGGEGYGRVDLRVTEDGQPYVLEVNPWPRPLEQRRPRPDGPRLRLELRRPRHADRGRGAHALPEPQRRRGPGQRGVRRVSGTLTLPSLRHLTAADRGRIEEITRAVGLFRADEIPVALEVFDGAVAGSPDYVALGAERRRPPGRLDLLGSHALHPRHLRSLLDGGGSGAPRRRHRHRPAPAMEQRLAGVARLIVVETAGRPDYAATRAFYEARGYRAVSRIPGFLAPGDDQVVYVKDRTERGSRSPGQDDCVRPEHRWHRR